MSLLNSLNQVLDSTRAAGRRDREKGTGTKSNPSLERLESLCLLSTLHTIVEPTVTVPPTETNFGIGSDQKSGPVPFSPAIPLFDPSLGTLVAVHITGEAGMTSDIGAENLSRSSAATITASMAGSYQVDGLPGPAIAGTLSGQNQFNATTFDGTLDYGGTSGTKFTTTARTQPGSETLTSPSELAFFTAAPGRGSITPTFSAKNSTQVTAPGGNLATDVKTNGDAAARLTVSYDYIPAPPPSVVSVLRYGVHREQTQIIVTFSGKVDAAAASNPANYQLVRRGPDGQFHPNRSSIIPIKEVVYNPNTNTATIVPHKYPFRTITQLTINGSVFGSGGQNYSTVFGGKSSLGGFVYHHSGRFFAVHNGVVQFPQTTPPPGFLTNV